MGTLFEIRSAEASDTESIHSLIGEIAAFEKLEHEFTGTIHELRESLFGDAPSAEALVAVVDETVVGYAIYFENFSTFLCKKGIWLEDLFVTESFRKHGIGKALLEGVREVAIKRNAGRYEWSVLDWNQNAINFYERAGAEVLPDWRIVRTVL